MSKYKFKIKYADSEVIGPFEAVTAVNNEEVRIKFTNRLEVTIPNPPLGIQNKLKSIRRGTLATRNVILDFVKDDIDISNIDIKDMESSNNVIVKPDFDVVKPSFIPGKTATLEAEKPRKSKAEKMQEKVEKTV